MYLVRQLQIKKRKSEKGFVLIATLFGMLILIAVSIFALTMTTQDLKTSGRYYAERRAFFAAESGLTTLCLKFDTQNIVAITATPVDPTDSATGSYKHTQITLKNEFPATRSDLTVGGGGAWKYQAYNTIVTGIGGGQGSEVSIDATLKHGPVPGDAGYR